MQEVERARGLGKVFGENWQRRGVSLITGLLITGLDWTGMDWNGLES